MASQGIRLLLVVVMLREESALVSYALGCRGDRRGGVEQLPGGRLLWLVVFRYIVRWYDIHSKISFARLASKFPLNSVEYSEA